MATLSSLGTGGGSQIYQLRATAPWQVHLTLYLFLSFGSLCEAEKYEFVYSTSVKKAQCSGSFASPFPLGFVVVPTGFQALE